jgi:hypothetical protein
VLQCGERSWPPPPKPRPQPPPRERLRQHLKRSTNASTAIEHSVAANTEVDTNDRVSLLTYFYFVQARDEGQPEGSCRIARCRQHATTPPSNHKHPPSSPLTSFANTLIMQTRRSVPLNAKNVEVPSFVEISCSATTELCMPKMEECPFSLKGEKEQAPPRHRPRTQSRPSTSTRARWSR